MGRQPEDLTGQIFGRLTVLGPGPYLKRGSRRLVQWVCRCECGEQPSVLASGLKNGSNKSCGCLGRDISKGRAIRRQYSRNAVPPVTVTMQDWEDELP